MPTSQIPNPKNSSAFYMQATVSFGVALFAVMVAVYYLPAEPWIKAFFALSICYLVTSAFTLAKVIRDRQEDEAVVSRLDQARLEKALVTHDPFKGVAS
jgi:hypothetical protein